MVMISVSVFRASPLICTINQWVSQPVEENKELQGILFLISYHMYGVTSARAISSVVKCAHLSQVHICIKLPSAEGILLLFFCCGA